MSLYYIYLSLLLLMFILIYYGASWGFKYAPSKIKIMASAGFIALSLRYICLIIFLVAKNIRYLYLLKPLVFLNLLCLPVLSILALYIYARCDKIKFNYCLAACGMFIVLYLYAVTKLPASIVSIGNLGYLMSFTNSFLVYGVYVIINTIFLFAAIILLDNKNANKFGIWILLLSVLIQIVEILLSACDIKLFPVIIIGDICLILTSSYALYKFKK